MVLSEKKKCICICEYENKKGDIRFSKNRIYESELNIKNNELSRYDYIVYFSYGYVGYRKFTKSEFSKYFRMLDEIRSEKIDEILK